MSLSDEPIYPIDLPPPDGEPPVRSESRARRRRARRQIVPPDAQGRAALIASLARRATPTYEFFIFAVLCGALLGLGYILDSQSVLIFGSLLAPLMLPWVGMTLSLVIGSLRFYFETLVALLIAAALVLLTGALAGFASRPFLPRTFNNAFIHSQLWIPDLVVLVIGSILLTASVVRSEEKPYLPSVMLAYSLFLPLSAAGFGLGSGVDGIWPQGMLVFVVHLAVATSFGLTTFFILRFRPTLTGLGMSGAALVVIVGSMAYLMGAGYGFSGGAAVVPGGTPTNAAPQAGSLTPDLTLASLARPRAGRPPRLSFRPPPPPRPVPFR
jgi:hypothetical protein